ncbi:MAG: PEP-CTERM sorting domain-containing protein [Rhodospirillaceae bacterium]
MKRLAALMAIGSSVCALSAAQAAPVLIDNYTTGQCVSDPAIGAFGCPTEGGVATGVNSIGSARFLRALNQNAMGTVVVDVNNSTGFFGIANFLTYISGTNTDGDAFAIYDGDTNNTLDLGLGGGSGVDLTDGGLNSVFLLTTQGDHAFTFRVRVYTSLTDYSTLDFAVPVAPLLTYNLPFASFTDTGAGADFTAAKAIELSIFAPTALDAQIDLFAASIPVPEPAPLGLLGLGLLGLAAARPRRRDDADSPSTRTQGRLA